MANHGLNFLVLCFVSTIQGYFIQMLADTRLRWHHARELCEDNGMTLPVLPTEDDYNNFFSVVGAIALSQGVDNPQTWLGLTHDGGNGSAMDHMTWTDGQQLTYTRSRPNSIDLDVQHFNISPPFFCVRMNTDNMRVSNCNLRRGVVCQGNLTHQTEHSPIFYTETDYRQGQFTNTTRFYATSSESELPLPLNLRSPSPRSSADIMECFHQCVQLTSCHVVAVLRDKSSCYLQL